MKTKRTIFSAIFLGINFLICTFVFAQQPGMIDTTFNSGDKGFGFGDGANGSIYTTAIQSDGKIIIGGDFTSYNGTTINRIARLNADGSLDNTFNIGTGANNYVFTIAIQSDGKIIIGGALTKYNGKSTNYIARLNADGSLDNSFNPGAGASGTVSRICLQTDGKIIIGGSFTFYNVTPRKGIARLNADGSLDNTFNPGTGTNAALYAICLQSDGKIIIGGYFTSYNGTAKNYIARLNADGSLDNTFNLGIGASGTVGTICLQGDGKIIIGGDFASYNGTMINRIARLNADGTLDNSFNVGTGTNNYVLTTAIQSDGKIIIGGIFTAYNGTANNHIVRLNADGTLDNAFNVGTGANNSVRTTCIQNDGKIIIGGDFTSYNGTITNYIACLNSDGTLDSSFNNVGTGANNGVRTTCIQNNGKIIIGGDFTSYNGTSRKNIARLNANGMLDSSFNNIGTGANNSVWTTAIQNDGKIIIGGYFTSYNGTTINHIARLNADGTLDNTFNVGTGTNLQVYTTAIQSDGKIIIGGWFTSYNGTTINRLARLNADGTLDNSFNVGTGANSWVNTTSIQSDGKIIIGGVFTNYNGTGSNRVARINSDGTLDNSFNIGTGVNNDVLTTCIQNDGKIIIGGGFTLYNGTSRNDIARLNSDGTVDNTFNIGAGTNSYVYATSMQSDGKIIIGGDFTGYNGTMINRIARLNADGSLDNTFTVGTGANSDVYTTAIQSDGKIIIGGDFTGYNGTGRNRIARLIGGNCAPPIINTSGNVTICSGQNTTLTASGGSVYLWNTGATTSSISISPTANTTYTLSVSNGNCSDTGFVNVIVNPIPSVPSITQNGSALVSSSSSFYQWYLNGIIINGATGSTCTPTQNGNYSVVVTDANGCTNTSAAFNITLLGIDEINNAGTVKIYPNPFSSSATIEISEQAAGNTENLFFVLYNLLGEEIKNIPFLNSKAEIFKNDLPAGIYSYQIKHENKIIGKGKVSIQ